MTLNIISADNHVMEPPGTFVDRVPAALKERVPRFEKALDGGEGWSWDGTPPASSPVPNTMGTGGTGWTWSQIRPGNHDGTQHLKDMALDGIDAAVLYPGMAGGLYTMADQAARLACFRAYNDWLLDEFCAADPTRLVGVCLVPTDDSEADMLAEAERVLARGARALYLPMFPRRQLLEPFYDPLWKLATDADVTVSIHNFGGRTRTDPRRPRARSPHHARVKDRPIVFYGPDAVVEHDLLGLVCASPDAPIRRRRSERRLGSVLDSTDAHDDRATVHERQWRLVPKSADASPGGVHRDQHFLHRAG